MRFPFKISHLPIHGPNAFGAIRKYDVHTGIDFFCEEGQEVVAMEDGVIVNICPFTGQKAFSPWWNETSIVLVESKMHVIGYGEIEPVNSLKIGQKIKEGDLLGNVLRVLKNDKGLPTTMLHLELYKKGTIEPVWWNLNSLQPNNLLNPTDILLKMMIK